MKTDTIVDNLFRYSMWANDRIFDLCDGLSDAQLDLEQEMGFGSLRNTMHHIVAAEEIWLSRWLGEVPPAMSRSAEGASLETIRARFQLFDWKRRAFLEQGRSGNWQTPCHYRDLRGNSHTTELLDLLIHVANHGIHHRAQAMNFLRGFGRVIPGGIDYLFFRFAHPALQQTPEATQHLRQMGLEAGSATGEPLRMQPEVLRRGFQYSDWANSRLLDCLKDADNTRLDRSFEMGQGTIRKTLLHIHDVEQWWFQNWTEGSADYKSSPADISLAAIRVLRETLVGQRNRFLAALDESSADRVCEIQIGGIAIRVSVLESLIQLIGHGTHHRAQVLNMIRREGVTPPAVDYVLWARERQI